VTFRSGTGPRTAPPGTATLPVPAPAPTTPGTGGRELPRRRGVVAEFVDLAVHYPGMLLALAGTLLLVLVTVTSVRRARRRPR